MRFYAIAQRPFIEDERGGFWGLPPGTIGAVDLSAVGARNRVFVTSDQPFAVGGDILAAFGDGTRLDQLALSGRARNDWNNLLGVSEPNGTILLDALWNVLTIHADPDGLTRAKPIMPTRRGVLELHLGGHSLLRAEKLPEDPTQHPAWANIQAVKQRDCRAIHSHDETLARKWLGNEQRRFRLTPEAATDLLVPSDLPRLEPIRPTTEVSDDFNRDDGGLGSDWADERGTWEIISNEAHVTSAGFNNRAIHNTALSSDDHYAESDTQAGSASGGAKARATPMGTSNACYNINKTFSGGAGGPVLELGRIDSGGFTRTVIFTDTVLAGSNRIGLECDGSSIRAYSTVRTPDPVTDTNVTGHLQVGLETHFADRTFDNFEGGDLLADEADHSAMFMVF